MNQLSEYDVAVNAKLTAMKNDGWQAIKDMSGQQLDEFMDELNATGRLYNSLNPFVILRGEAVRAVKDERHARNLKIMMENQERQNRRDFVNQVVSSLNTARANLEKLSEIQDLDLYELFETPPQPQRLSADYLEGKDDAVLISLLQAYNQQAQRARESQAVAAEKVDAFAFAKPREARSPERFFGVVANGWAECADITTSNMQSISDELDRRRAEREAQEEAMRPKSLLERIEQLEAQLAESEDK